VDRFVSLATIGGFACWIFQFFKVDHAIEQECSFELIYFLNFIHLRSNKRIYISSVLYPLVNYLVKAKKVSDFTSQLTSG